MQILSGKRGGIAGALLSLSSVAQAHTSGLPPMDFATSLAPILTMAANMALVGGATGRVQVRLARNESVDHA